MQQDGKIGYLEMPGNDLGALKSFYSAAFGWTFTDYGPSYAAFNAGLDGGFQTDAAEELTKPLPVLYANNLDHMEAKVRAAGGVIVRAPFDFPGGRRFHFTDPSGNELAVASYDE